MTTDKISLADIYQHKLNFLIGSGASYGLFPTLWLSIKCSSEPTKRETIETIATKLDQAQNRHHLTLLFMYYYKRVIEPVYLFNIDDVLNARSHSCAGDESCISCIEQKQKQVVIENYEKFLEAIVRLLQQKSELTRRCNLFTTNYDGCFQLVSDRIFKKGELQFVVNDGSSGFLEKTLSARNFNNYWCESGVFGRHLTDVPQINLINLHGSAYWRKKEDLILVDYSNSSTEVALPSNIDAIVDQVKSILEDGTKNTQDFLDIPQILDPIAIESFWKSYNQLPIVNPTKWKFFETVFEEHYYQMLRLLSYRLEEQNSILISFGFSFNDEHILNLVKRSLSNPKLLVFICCFDNNELTLMESRFRGHKNIHLVALDRELNFSEFNAKVFDAGLLRSESL